MGTSRKKAVLRQHAGQGASVPIAGYVTVPGFWSTAGVDLLDLSGKARAFPFEHLKWLCLVRDFNSGDPLDPERMLRRSFAGRPRTEGLMLRLQLTDGEAIEGLAENSRSLMEPPGLFLVPPDLRGNTQRIWIPHCSIRALEVLAVLGRSKARRLPEPFDPAVSDGQQPLF